MSHSDDSELNVSADMHTPMKQVGRKRKSDSTESVNLPIYGNIGTPMPTVNVEDEEEWDNWKKEELAKAGNKPIVKRRPPPFVKGELPKISDSEHLRDRKVHREVVKKARKEVLAALDAINQQGLNVADDDEIAIQINGKNLSKRLCKKYQKALKKDMKKEGIIKTEDIFSEDEDDKEFNKKWAPQREKMLEDWSEIRELETDDAFDPLEEYMHEIDDRTGDKVTGKGYYKWLSAKVKAGAISWKYTYYEQEYRKMRERQGLKCTTKRKFKKLVKNVQDFYKDHHH